MLCKETTRTSLKQALPAPFKQLRGAECCGKKELTHSFTKGGFFLWGLLRMAVTEKRCPSHRWTTTGTMSTGCKDVYLASSHTHTKHSLATYVPPQTYKPRSTYTHTQLHSHRREAQSHSLFLLLLLSFPLLLVCACHLRHWRRGGGGGKLRGRSEKNKPKSTSRLLLAADLRDEFAGEQNVNELPAKKPTDSEREYQIEAVWIGVSGCETHTRNTLPEGARYPLLELTSISLRYCPTYRGLTRCAWTCMRFPPKLATGLFVHNSLCVCVCVMPT